MTPSDPDQDHPIAELAAILEQESLESRFQRLLVSVFRRICDGGFYPARDLLDMIERRGAVAFAQDWLRDERAQPAFDLLCTVGRIDLTIEGLVPRVPYCRLFTDEEQGLASDHRSAAPGLSWVLNRERRSLAAPVNEIEWARTAVENLRNDRAYTGEDLLALQRRRNAAFRSLSIPGKVAALENELREGYPFSCSAEIVSFVLHQPDKDIRHDSPTVAGCVRDIHDNVSSLIAPVIDILRPALDLSSEKTKQVSAVIKRSESETSRILAERAALICSKVSKPIRLVAEAFFSDEQEFPFSVPGRIFTYFDPADALLLRTAVILEHLLPCDLLGSGRVFSFGDLQKSAALAFQDFESATATDLSELDAEGPTDVDMESVILFVQTQLVIAAYKGLNSSLPAIPAPAETKIDGLRLSQLEDLASRYELVLAISGTVRRLEAEGRIRTRLGPLFDALCAEAKTALLGAEFTLMDGWHPEPGLAIVAICVAFEHQLKASLLGPLAKYVLNRGFAGKFPTQAIPIVENGHLLHNKPLEHVTRAMRTQHPLWDQFCKSYEFDLDALVATINVLKDKRNQAAHEGGVSRERVIQYQNELMDAKHGCFTVLLPRGLKS